MGDGEQHCRAAEKPDEHRRDKPDVILVQPDAAHLLYCGMRYGSPVQGELAWNTPEGLFRTFAIFFAL